MQADLGRGSLSMLDRNEHVEVLICLYCLRHVGTPTDDEIRSISLRNSIESPGVIPEISKSNTVPSCSIRLLSDCTRPEY